jgi:hypothetical protein
VQFIRTYGFNEAASYLCTSMATSEIQGCLKKSFEMVIQMLLCGECYEKVYI